jgi:nitrate reductase NapE component
VQLISAIVSHVTPPAYEIYCLLFLHIWPIAAALFNAFAAIAWMLSAAVCSHDQYFRVAE